MATACSNPPEGRARWTLELLAGEMVRLTGTRSCRARRCADGWPRTISSRGQGHVVHSADRCANMSPAWRMCSTSTPKPRSEATGGMLRQEPDQLIGEVRQPIRPRRARMKRCDCEYRRNGTASLFVFLDAHRPGAGEGHRAARGRGLRALHADFVDLHYPRAERIRVVLDNLSTHSRRRPLRGIPRREACRFSARSSSITPQARKLAQHGRDRDRRPAHANASIGPSTATLGWSPRPPPWDKQQMPNARPHQLDVPQPKKQPHQNGLRLSKARRQIRPT